MFAAEPTDASRASGGLEVTTRQTIVATANDEAEGMTLDEMASFLRRAMAAGIDPATRLRARTSRRGAITSVSVEGIANSA